MSHNIDHIFYINIEHRTDRRNEIEGELKQYGLIGERYNAIYIQNGGGCLGCSYSHLNVLKIARERGYKNVLILEDDFKFTVSKEELEEGLNHLFSLPFQFDVCMLGYNLQNGTIVDEYPFLTKVYEAQTASAYLVNQSMYDKLIAVYEWAVPLLESTGEHWNYICDQSWKSLQPDSHWYCFTTRMGIQRPSYSDCGNQYVIYEC